MTNPNPNKRFRTEDGDEDSGQEIPPDEQTPWISCSRDLPWCIWEIARRLSQGDPEESVSVELAAMKLRQGEVSVEPRGPIGGALKRAKNGGAESECEGDVWSREGSFGSDRGGSGIW